MRKAEENTRTKTKCEQERVEEHTTKEFELCRRFEIAIGTLVQIVAAIVMKAVYKRAAEISHQDQNIGGVWLSHNLYRSTRVPGECAVGRCPMAVFLWHALAAWRATSKFPHFLFCPP